MLQRQGSTTSTGLRTDTKHRTISFRLLSSILIGIGITLVITLVEGGVFFLLPSSSHSMGSNRFTELTHLLMTLPLLLIPLGEFALATLIVFLAVKPLALISYLRAVQSAQEEYHQLYTPLKALTNIRKTTETYQQDATPPTIVMQEEKISILELVREQDSNILILGVPGAGKTTALRVYQYDAALHPFELAFKRGRLPIYIPMKNYSLFLKKYEQRAPLAQDTTESTSVQQVTLLDFLYASDLPGIQHIKHYLQQLSDQGQLLLLCDGLNEVDSNYLTRVSEELARWMSTTRNRLVMTCREVDYREQREFEQLVEEGQASRVVIYPLQSEQVNEFVERYIERQDKQWKHTAGQIMQVIDRSRLRYHCTNPMMLFTLMGIIDKIGVERGKSIDTRGRLLREYVRQLIEYEQRQPRWSKAAPDEREVIRFLSEIACAARWSNDRNAIQLRISSPALIREGEKRRASLTEVTDELQIWLDEHPARGPFANENIPYQPYEDLAQLLQFALSAALIEISPGGVLSFRHELITEYFVAEYFYTVDGIKSAATGKINEALLENVSRWSEPVAIWAGLLDNPLLLAERFGALGLSKPEYVLQALTLGLICVGVLWTPPQATTARPVILPGSIEEALSIAVRNKAAREELARIFTRCAEEGGQEVYRSLLPLVMVEGVDDLLTLLDQNIVPNLLFSYLQDTIENVAYEPQVKRLTRILGRFGSSVIEQATTLSLPAPGKSPRLRSAAVNILGGTRDVRAVEPLIARLGDAENFVTERAINGLIRLGPELTLSRVSEELESDAPAPLGPRLHYAALMILGRFLAEKDIRKQVSFIQFRRIIEALIPVLTSQYQAEPDVQGLALTILVTQGQDSSEAGKRDNRLEYFLKLLVSYLSTQNEIAARNIILALQNIGAPAIPYELDALNHQTDFIRIRIIEILKEVRDARALPPLLTQLATNSTAVQQQVAAALIVYAPESISGLLDLVLHHENELLAERASHILSSIGVMVVEPIISLLFNVVPGRTRYLIQVLAQIHDVRCVPALITLLHTPELEPLLAIAIVRTLGQFAEQQVVPPLLEVLASPNAQLSIEAIDALTQLGPLALQDLVQALNAPGGTLTTQRVKRVILGIVPFPGSQLMTMLAESSPEQRQNILDIFQHQGAEAALVLARNIEHPNPNVRLAIQHTLGSMPGAIVVPALLDILYQPELRPIASTFLLKYAEAAISPLVELLGERERGDIAAQILPHFGVSILQPLISGLDDQRSKARELAQRIIVTLVRQSQDSAVVLHEIVHLFHVELPERARDVLLRVLTNELADVSQAALIDGLEDAHLIDDVADAFVLLMHKASQQKAVLAALLASLAIEERRRGASTALIRIGAPAVLPVGELITDANPAVAHAAHEILREIGAPALGFIWTAHSDNSNPARREAALDIFHAMPTDAIKEELIARLVSNKIDDISMAVSLLLERVHDEISSRYADQSMIQVLVEYVQTHGVENTNQRVIALLLLLGDHNIIDHFISTLDEYQQHRKPLLYALLLLGEQAQEILLTTFQNDETSMALRAEIATILGMTSAPDVVTNYAQNLSQYGIAENRTGILVPEELNIALRALGGLLAGGTWNLRTLQGLRNASPDGSPAKELYSVLLGKRYEPQLTQLQGELQTERETRKQAVQEFTQRILSDQARIQDLEQEIGQLQQKQEVHSDELQETLKENQELRQRIERMLREQNQQTNTIQELTSERDELQNELAQAERNNTILIRRAERIQEEKELLTAQYDRLVQQLQHPNTR